MAAWFMDDFSGNSPGSYADPFTRFWSDCASKMMGAAFTSGNVQLSDEGLKQMRRAFFDAWAHHCDEFMRSPAFLEGMKKAMDGALAFREQLNEFMTRALHEAQVPARSDTDSIMLVLRSMEERVLDRLDRLEDRVAAIEDGDVEEGSAGGSSSSSRSQVSDAPRNPTATGKQPVTGKRKNV